MLNGDVEKMAFSLLLGTIVGLEREVSEKPAGLKTNVLICIGSTVFTILSVHLAGGANDPARIAAQIVSGIGFLGAGAILREGEHVTGLTTAAIIWVVAAIGMSVGLGQYRLALLGTLGTLIVQVGLARLDMVVDRYRRRHTFRILSAANEHAVELIAKILKSHRIRVMGRKVMKRDNLYHTEWSTSGSPVGQERAVAELLKSDQVVEITY